MNTVPINSRLRSLYAPFFSGWRLIYIPAATLTHAGHGAIWPSALLGLLLTFGGEWLARRGHGRLDRRRQDLLVVIVALLLLGFFPEETPIGLILWTGIGLAWGELWREEPAIPATWNTWWATALGALLGLTGLLGPGSWLMALLLVPLLWQPPLSGNGDQNSDI